jgi:hypothetical protein
MKKDKFKYWPYLLTAGILLVFSAFAPFLFTKYYSGIVFNSETGSIGDTIGGITAPFLSLIGAILVFAALRAQVKANEIVFKQFDKEEKEKIEESLNKIELLSVDLGSIIKDVELRAQRMKEYYEKELEKPFELNVLKRTSSRVYSRVTEFERLSIFKGFKQFKTEQAVWINHYNNLYGIFDYLPDFYDSVYQLHDRHIKDIFDQKMAIRKRLLDLMELSTKYIEEFKKRHPIISLESSPEWTTVNQLILDYHTVIDESFGPSGETIKETDFEKISTNVLQEFIESILKIRRENPEYDSKVMPLLEISAEVRREVELIKQRATEFSNNVKVEYKKLAIDHLDNESILTKIKQLKIFIDKELNKIQRNSNQDTIFHFANVKSELKNK